jgi:hypothetical protein
VYVIGVTASRRGPTDRQRESLFGWVEQSTHIHEQLLLIHGDCVGGDKSAHLVAVSLGLSTGIHPPVGDRFRAFCEPTGSHGYIRQPKGYFPRDRDIVMACNELIVMPMSLDWSFEGGTRYTHDYAVKMNRTRVMIWRDGRLEVNHGVQSGQHGTYQRLLEIGPEPLD